MITFKPFDAEIYTPDGQVSREAVAYRPVDIQPAKAAVTFDQFGVDIQNASILYDDVDGASFYVEQGEVVADGVTYVIRGVKVWKTLPVADHVMVLLERKA